MGLNSLDLCAADIHVGILGVPYDGSVTHEPGAAFAPHVLREISADRWPLTENFVDLTPLKIRDFGDVPVDNDDAGFTQEAITKAVAPIADAAIPLVLGGDHSITSGVVSAFQKNTGILWIDSHPDLMDVYKGLKGKKESKWNHACPLRRILELPHVRTEDVLIFGVRDFTPEELAFIQDNNIDVMYAQELAASSIEAVVNRIGSRFAHVPHVYISFDIDVLDPAYAPGTGVPIPGGISTRYLLDIIFHLFEKEKQWLKEGNHFLNIAGFDLVEIAPPLDVGHITCYAGISIIMSVLGYICLQEGLHPL
jgi:agmatinase